MQVYRNSGKPIDIDNAIKYEEDWRSFYDKASERSNANMLKLQRFLSFGEMLIRNKYSKEYTVDSFDELRILIIDYGYPILLGISADTQELIAIIQDV